MKRPMPLYPGYPDNYTFGQNGDFAHAGGYDGWPSDHPNNPHPGEAGQGGDALSGSGAEGGKGGTGVGQNGGDGGKGDGLGAGGAGGTAVNRPNENLDLKGGHGG